MGRDPNTNIKKVCMIGDDVGITIDHGYIG